jgi:soluble lytic murein transglycosylase-like protein
MKLLVAAVLVCLAGAVPAQAQIYAWRDASGSLVLSNKPLTGGIGSMTTYAVPGPTLIRTTTKPPSAGDVSRYDDIIRQHAASHGISVDLVRAVIQAESGFNPLAISPKGAMGLMQLMPATARELGVNDPFQPSDNIRGGVTYLARLLARFKQNVELALAAYNAGPGSVDKYGGVVPPYRETQAYVKKITAKPGVTAAVTPPPPPVMYKWTELVDGRPTIRYSNVAPKGGTAYDTIGQR